MSSLSVLMKSEMSKENSDRFLYMLFHIPGFHVLAKNTVTVCVHDFW